jgi:predicted secreted Zn-dependent protease
LFFVPNKSWVKSEYKSDFELLKHEQLHFDISELYARKFREQLSKMSFTENVKIEISDLYEKITKKKIELQNEYDIETDHSVNILKQKQWGQKILIELQKRASYASK